VVLLLVAVVVLATPARSTDEIAAPPAARQRARAPHEGQVQKHPVLEDVTVELSDTLDHQAVAYYTEGRIVISTAHTASIDHIIEHEVWHVIDWRDNGRIDWGESVPPSDSPT
jgi:hypothetical protein